MNETSVVVITGGGGVLCSAMAEHLGALGYKVAVLGRTLETVASVADTINKSGGTAFGVSADVMDKESLMHAKSRINDELGPCNILINGAGGNHSKGTTSKTHFETGDEKENDLTSFFDLDPDGVKHVMDLNFIGSLLPCQVFAKDMLGRPGCSILNVSSMSAYTPLTKIPAYSGAKAAITNFTQWLAVHFAKEGIRVNAIAPGFFLTEQNRSLLTNEDGSLTDRGNKIVDHTPMGKFGDPEDLLGTVEWICGEGSSFVTGVTIPVDGGFSAFSGV